MIYQALIIPRQLDVLRTRIEHSQEALENAAEHLRSTRTTTLVFSKGFLGESEMRRLVHVSNVRVTERGVEADLDIDLPDPGLRKGYSMGTE